MKLALTIAASLAAFYVVACDGAVPTPEASVAAVAEEVAPTVRSKYTASPSPETLKASMAASEQPSAPDTEFTVSSQVGSPTAVSRDSRSSDPNELPLASFASSSLEDSADVATVPPHEAPTLTPLESPVPTTEPSPVPDPDSTLRSGRFLETDVKPCRRWIPDVDPCEPGKEEFHARSRRVNFQIQLNTTLDGSISEISAEVYYPDPPLTIEDRMIKPSLNQWGRFHRVPHFVIRGTYVPGSTSCGFTEYAQSKSLVLAEPEAGPQTTTEVLDLPDAALPILACTTDVAVNEYMVGIGPETLTVVSYYSLALLVFENYNERFEGATEYDYGYALHSSGIADIVGNEHEGRETVMWLGTPGNVAIKAWIKVHEWDVQSDGSDVLVVHPHRQAYEETPENLSRLEFTLGDYRAQTIAGHEKLRAKHDGRMGEHKDALMILVDASDASLESHLRAEGAYDYPPWEPAPIPTPDSAIVYPTPTPLPTLAPQPTATLYPTPYPIDLSARVVVTEDGLAIVLTWNAPSPDEQVADYRIWRNDENPQLTSRPVNEGFEITGPGTSHIDTFEIEPDTTYVYAVEYINSRGGGIRNSKKVEITTPSE